MDGETAAYTQYKAIEAERVRVGEERAKERRDAWQRACVIAFEFHISPAEVSCWDAVQTMGAEAFLLEKAKSEYASCMGLPPPAKVDG